MPLYAGEIKLIIMAETKNILITGATGNIGHEVISYLNENKTDNAIFAGVRNIETAKKKVSYSDSVNWITFDFERPEYFDKAIKNIDRVFLIRPPHISNVKKYFSPFVKSMKRQGVKEIVFLSVQGAEKSNVIPHRKIEKLILNSGLEYIFIRPSYFMQNLTTTLSEDIRKNHRIVLPAGRARFNWVDGKNAGEVGAVLLEHFEYYANQEIDITGYENLNFYEVRDLMRKTLNIPLEYSSPDPVKYFFMKRREGVPTSKILVMIMLHFLRRFQKDPSICECYEQITGEKPTSLEKFLERERDLFKVD